MEAIIPSNQSIRARRGPKRAGRIEGWVSQEGLLRMRVRANSTMLTGKDVSNLESLRKTLIEQDSAIFCLMDARGIKHVEREARRHKPHANTERLAVLIDSAVGRMLGNAFMAVVRPHCPTRMFTSEQKAVEWLLSGS